MQLILLFKYNKLFNIVLNGFSFVIQSSSAGKELHKKSYIKSHINCTLCAGQDRAEEEVTQLEDKDSDGMRWTVTGLWMKLDDWIKHILRHHSTRVQQIQCHSNKGNASWFTHSWEFTDF